MKSNKLLKSCLDFQIQKQGYGYIQHLEIIEKKSKTYNQVKCDRCGLYHLWKLKEPQLTNLNNN